MCVCVCVSVCLFHYCLISFLKSYDHRCILEDLTELGLYPDMIWDFRDIFITFLCTWCFCFTRMTFDIF